MSIVDLIMPKLGESITEATILKWHKKVGDKVEHDESVLDIATDKVDSEVPSTVEGTIEEILFKENDIVPIGRTIAKIRVDNLKNNHEEHYSYSTSNAGYDAGKQETIDIPYQPSNSSTVPKAVNKIRFYSPLVLNIAAGEGISMQELENIPGTGLEERVSKKDILEYIQKRNQRGLKESFQSNVIITDQDSTKKTQNQPQAQQQAVLLDANNKEETKNQPFPVQHAQSVTTYSGNIEIIEMDRMRKMIAKHMVDSKNISAHVTSFSECDVTNLVLWREKIKKEFEKRENEKITFTPLFIEAIVKCIKKYPWLNSSVDGEKIILKKDINIGMATAMPNGNLIVPVIRNADQLNIVGLTKRVNSLANAARNNQLFPDDTTSGTFTLTNVGSFGSIMGTPIINQPQVAILAVGAIKKRPVVIETEQGDSIAIRHMMYLSLSYDHRIIDGSLGSTFLNAVTKELENFDGNRSL